MHCSRGSARRPARRRGARWAYAPLRAACPTSVQLRASQHACSVAPRPHRACRHAGPEPLNSCMHAAADHFSIQPWVPDRPKPWVDPPLTAAFERLADELHQRRAPQALRFRVAHAGVGSLIHCEQHLAHRDGPNHLRAAAALPALGLVGVRGNPNCSLQKTVTTSTDHNRLLLPCTQAEEVQGVWHAGHALHSPSPISGALLV